MITKMKKYLIPSLIIVAALSLGGCSKEIMSEQPIGDTDIKRLPDSGNADSLDTEIFSLLNLDYSGLEKVKQYYADGDIYNAGQSLLDYWRTRPVYNPSSDVLTPSATASEQNIAAQATSENGWRFQVYNYVEEGTAGSGTEKYWSFAGEDGKINWATLPASLASETEFKLQKHRLQWMLPQAKTYKLTGNEKYILAWIEAWKSWNETYPVPEGTTSAMEWCQLQPCSRVENILNALPYYASSENLTAEVLAYTLHTIYNHVESIRKNLFADATSNIRLSQEQIIAEAGILLPEFKQSEVWFNEGIAAVTAQLSSQFNEDGVHNEFDPSYHLAAVADFISVYKTAQLNGKVSELPSDYAEGLRKAAAFIKDIIYPNYSIDNFNDTRSIRMTKSVLQRNLRQYSELFPDDEELKWIATGGTYGKKPETSLITYPVSGYYMMRNGWTQNSVMLIHKNCYDSEWKGHNQSDNGHIGLYVNGRSFLPDAGCYSYSGSDRTIYASSEMHNTITKNQQSFTKRAGKLLKTESTTGYEVLVTENESYADLTHRRAIFFVDKRYFVVVDEAYGGCYDTPINLNFKLWGGQNKDASGYPESGKAYTVIDSYENNAYGAHSTFSDGNNLLIKSFSETSDNISFASNTGYYSNEIGQRTQRYWFRLNVDKKEGKAVRFISVLLPYTGTFEANSVSAEFTDNTAATAGTFHENGVSLKVTVNGETKSLSYKL